MQKRIFITLVKTAYFMNGLSSSIQLANSPLNFKTIIFLTLGVLFLNSTVVLEANAQCTRSELPLELFASIELEREEWPTSSKEMHVGLELNPEVFAQLRLRKYDALDLRLPFLNGKELLLELEMFLPFSENFSIGRTQESGKLIEEQYMPQLLSYRIVSAGMRGTIVIMKDQVIGTLQYQGKQYDLSALRGGEDGKHVLFLLSDSAHPLEFECAVDEFAPRREVMPMGIPAPSSSSMLSECVEVAIDIDNYTYGTFGNDCYPAVEWALALLAGVNTIYTNDLDGFINIQASFVHIWEATDPYEGITGNAGSMLDTFRLEWLTNTNLTNIQRDLVHLMTRRLDTGTGGIAYLDAVCSSQYGCGFSANLNPTTTYDLSNYSWNLNVVGHELGHNFGSNHTHWCGWPGGPIDNCYEAEGSCTNEPQAQVGTMMSYCHAVSGGSVNLNFHPTVINSALLPTINSDGACFNTCVDLITSCAYYGCTNELACNYSSDAVQDDGTCAFNIDACGVCGGDNATCTGCMDSAACNYDSEATINDSSCFFPDPGSSCDCALDVSFDVQLAAGETASQTINGFGYITGFSVVLDFTDSPADQSWANEMMVGITAPDGTCLQYGGYNLTLNCPSAGLWPPGWSVSTAGIYTATAVFSEAISGTGDWTITLLNSWNASVGALYNTTLTFDGLCEASNDVLGCTSSTACNYNPLATLDDDSCEFTSCAGCTDNSACNYDTTASIEDNSCEYLSCAGCTDNSACNYDTTASIDNNSCEYLSCAGCTDNGACNYDALATIEDNSCEYLSCAGCTDNSACNYDALATIEDNSCEFTSCLCQADLNGDDQISVSDILIFLSDFGCVLSPCPGDVDGDAQTGVSDLLILLNLFGGFCD